jgi:hypothetical protein
VVMMCHVGVGIEAQFQNSRSRFMDFESYSRVLLAI